MAMGDPVRCPICEEPAAPDRRRVRSSVYVFCCERCAPRIRRTFELEREQRDLRQQSRRRDRDPGAAA